MSRHDNAGGLGGGAPDGAVAARAAEATSQGAAAATSASAATAQPKRGRAPLVFTALGVLTAAGAIWGGAYWWTTGRHLISTDDAYVRADITLLAAKVSGYVTEVLVDANQEVKTGEIIARIDPGDHRLALEAARDKEQTQQAVIRRITHQIEAARSAVTQAGAQVLAAKADLVRAAADLDRQNRLAQRDISSQQKLELARADQARADAAVKAAEAAAQSAKANVAVLLAQRGEAEGLLKELQTATSKAERDLTFTEVRAPVDGVVGNRAVQTGQYVQPGARLAAIVPLDDVYIDANFKETQIKKLRPGQKVSFTVDAFPGRDFHATVASLSPASGALFSLLPPDNATGNFTKIVQRLPVRLRIDRQDVAQHVLRPGLSVVATVDSRTGPEGGAAQAGKTQPPASPAVAGAPASKAD